MKIFSRSGALVILIVALAIAYSTPNAQDEVWWDAEKDPSGELVERRSIGDNHGTGDNAYFNWTRGEIVVQGVGVATPDGGKYPVQMEVEAKRAAKLDAMRNLHEATGIVAMTYSSTANKQMLESDYIQVQGKGAISGAREVGKPVIEKDEKGGIKVYIWMKMSLSGFTVSLYDKINEIETKEREVTPIQSYDMEKIRPVKEINPSIKDDTYTGLIVDCTGLKGRPSVSPRIITEDQKEVYGSLKVNRLWLLNHGLAGYASDVTSAKNLQKDRIGDNPLVIKPVMVSGLSSDWAVVGDKDAELIASANKEEKFLDKCRVVFVLD
ncbi:MAG: hypothetical protein JW814_06710 [Candidatus Krumholzibacteriota bacterium]|nr:hypothetical protein [Candidatus Krumholzibacteriota bacterium]